MNILFVCLSNFCIPPRRQQRQQRIDNVFDNAIFWVFDIPNAEQLLESRMDTLQQMFLVLPPHQFIRLIPRERCKNNSHLITYVRRHGDVLLQRPESSM